MCGRLQKGIEGNFTERGARPAVRARSTCRASSRSQLWRFGRSLGVLPDLEGVEDAPEVANAEEGNQQVLEDANDNASLLAGVVASHEASDDGGDGAYKDGEQEDDEAHVAILDFHAVSGVDQVHFERVYFKNYIPLTSLGFWG